MPQILPSLYSETFQLHTTMVMWKGVPNHDYLLYKSFLKEFRFWMYMHQEGLKKKCFGDTNIFIWKKSIFNKISKKIKFSDWVPLFPSNIAFHFPSSWLPKIFLKTVKLYHRGGKLLRYISSGSFNVDFIIYYVYRAIFAIFLTYSSYYVTEKRGNRRGGHDLKVLFDYIIYAYVCPSIGLLWRIQNRPIYSHES